MTLRAISIATFGCASELNTCRMYADELTAAPGVV